MSEAQNYVTEKELMGVGYTMISLTSVVFAARTLIRVRTPQRIQAEDYFLLLGYLCFLSLTIMYIVLTPTLFRVTKAATGLIPLYPTLLSDSLLVIKIFFANTMLFWFTLYAVKFSFLALYRRLMSNFKVYRQLWWAVVIFCILTLMGCVISNFTSCHSWHAWFHPGECQERRDVRAQIASLYYSYAVDVVSDLFIMFLPLRLIWNIQRPLGQKIGIGGLFCVGWVCIIFATIRVVQIGIKSKSSTPSSSWLAIWAIVESGVTIIVGCCPGLYTKAKEFHTTRKTSSKQSTIPQGYIFGSRGYGKQSSNNPTDSTMGFDDMISGPNRTHTIIKHGTNSSMELKHIPIKGPGAGTQGVQWKAGGARGSTSNGTFWADATSSQEELNGQKNIYVTSSIEIEEEDRRSSLKGVAR